MSKHLDNIIPFGSIFLAILFGAMAYHFTDAETFQNSEVVSAEIANPANKKVKALIVPGHDEKYFGAKYKENIEAEENLKIADELKTALEKNSQIEVVVLRDSSGYIAEFEKYFSENLKEIEKFRAENKQKTKTLIAQKDFISNQKVKHNFAPSEMSLRLYGINKWATENDFDFVIHVHLNDYPGRKTNSAGKYKGFSIYVPEKQLPNHTASLKLAEAVQVKLQNVLTKSNSPQETENIIEDQDLIAVGANHTLEIPSILIEYGYIYESLDYKKIAEQTADGVEEFLKLR